MSGSTDRGNLQYICLSRRCFCSSSVTDLSMQPWSAFQLFSIQWDDSRIEALAAASAADIMLLAMVAQWLSEKVRKMNALP